MDFPAIARNPWEMPARRNADRKLYLGEWIARLGLRPVEVARGVQVAESHLSNIIAHKKNASVALLMDISEFLGVTVNDLHRRPPPATAAMPFEGFSAGAVRLLMERKPL